MRIARLSGAIVLCAGIVAAGAGQYPAPSAQKQAGGAEAAIKAVADAYVKASLANDAKAIAALYTEDAVEMPPNEPMIKGRAAIQQHYEKLFASDMKVTAFSLTHIESYGMEDHGYDVGTYQQSMTSKDPSMPPSDSGKYTVILKRSGGDWKVAYAIYNSDRPMKQ
jgi:uncharacterized protein (TIGR02246 family)